MATTVKIDGLRELDQALGDLPKTAAKGVLRRVLQDAGEPLARRWRALAPRDESHYAESIDVSTRLSRRQRGLHRERGGKAFQEMFVGTNNPAGVQQEFGNELHGPQPSGRPAWDSTKGQILEHIANALWGEIQAGVKREAKKAARIARKAARG